GAKGVERRARAREAVGDRHERRDHQGGRDPYRREHEGELATASGRLAKLRDGACPLAAKAREGGTGRRVGPRGIPGRWSLGACLREVRVLPPASHCPPTRWSHHRTTGGFR